MYTLDGLNKIFLFYQGYVLETAPAMRMVGEMCIQKIGRVVGSFPLPGSLYGSNSGHVLLMTSSKKHQNMYIYTKYNFLFVLLYFHYSLMENMLHLNIYVCNPFVNKINYKGENMLKVYKNEY